MKWSAVVFTTVSCMMFLASCGSQTSHIESKLPEFCRTTRATLTLLHDCRSAAAAYALTGKNEDLQIAMSKRDSFLVSLNHLRSLRDLIPDHPQTNDVINSLAESETTLSCLAQVQSARIAATAPASDGAMPDINRVASIMDGHLRLMYETIDVSTQAVARALVRLDQAARGD
jgi:hypothetical protein